MALLRSVLPRAPGEPFGGTLKLRSGSREEVHPLTVKGAGVEDHAAARNGERVEMTLPPMGSHD